MPSGKAQKAGKAKPGKVKSKGVGVDFKRVKHKVGRKLPPPKNETKLDFTSKAIVLPEQSLAQNKDGVAVNQRKQTLKELLCQSTHYSERVRKESIVGIRDLISRHRTELASHAVAILEKLCPRITDGDRAVRQAFLVLLRSVVFPGLSEASMAPLVPVMMAHVCSAMTHLTMDIRLTAFGFLDLLVIHNSSLVVSLFSHQITQHFVDILGKGGVNKQSTDTVLKILDSLEHFLSALQTNASSTSSTRCLTTVHCWGEKYDLNSQRVDGAHISALHSYRSRIVQGTSKSGSLFPSPSLRSSLAPALLDCWAEYAPSVCAGPTPDSTNLSCMVCITRCLKLLVDIALNATSPFANPSGNADGERSLASSQKGREQYLWVQEQLLPGFLHHLMASFPVSASSVQLPQKVEVEVVALNVGICEVMMRFVAGYGSATARERLAFDSVLEYYRCALFGEVLPSSALSYAVLDRKLAEPHMKSLLGYMPRLVYWLPQDWVTDLLQAFTQVFQRSRAQSTLKIACVAAMVKMLLRQDKEAWCADDPEKSIPSEIQKHWLQSIPKLLWELKHSQPMASQAVLQMLLHIGQTAPEGSVLLEAYTALQPVMVPFFCASITSNLTPARTIFGPFVKLPEPCQMLAVDTLYYYKSLSPPFLKAIAQCCLSFDVNVTIVIRTVEVLQRSFCRGAISLATHLSFLVTLLVGHTSDRGQTDVEKGVPRGHDLATVQLTGNFVERRQCLIGGVICACLKQMGDDNLSLQLLGPIFRQELEERPPLDVVHGLLRTIGVLSHGGSRLPPVLADVLSTYVADFTESVVEIDGGDGVMDFVFRPCVVLLSKNSSLAQGVLEKFFSTLKEASGSSDFVRLSTKVFYATVRFLKEEKLASSLSVCGSTVKAILHLFKESSKSASNDEFQQANKLYLQLENAGTRLYGWKPEGVNGTVQR